MTRPWSRPSFRWSALAAAATVLVTACALFQDLDSSPYTLIDAGSEGGACVPDSGMESLGIACNPPCSGDDFCCVTVAMGAPTAACMTAAQCATGPGLAVALCNGACDCPPGMACTTQTCSFTGPVVVNACGMIPSCTAH